MANPSIRYGSSLRKRYNEIKKEKRMLYRCEICGRDAVKRINTSIWRCKHCNTTYAGGAYAMRTPAGEAAKKLIEDMQNR